MICKIYGIIDIIAALIVFFSNLPIPTAIKGIIALILVFKGIPSLFAD